MNNGDNIIHVYLSEFKLGFLYYVLPGLWVGKAVAFFSDKISEEMTASCRVERPASSVGHSLLNCYLSYMFPNKLQCVYDKVSAGNIDQGSLVETARSVK